MNFLPVVRRELQVAARKRSTFWVRLAAAVTGLALGAGCLVLSALRAVGNQTGSALFYALTWTCLAAGLGAGLFFTSDCLSEEKREGTLGLLFLTDLRGYDVGLGKLLATSLRGFYALLAVLPILALTQMMGGVSGAQYWKSSLALINALFCSLAAGLFVSSISRDSQKALAGTLLLVLGLAVAGVITDAIIAGVKTRGFQPAWSLSSPAYALASAAAWGRSAFWDALAISNAIGWGLLAAACLLLPRTWQDRARGNAGVAQGWAYSWKYGSRRQRENRRRKLLAREPVVWLVCRERWQAVLIWAVALLSLGGLAAILSRKPALEMWFIWHYLGGLLSLFVYVWVASQACRFLVDARRSGWIELLLVSPLPEREIVSGQWRAVRRMLGVPVLLVILVGVAGAGLSQLGWSRIAAQAQTAASMVTTNTPAAGTNQSVTTSTVVVVSPSGTTITSNSGTSRPRLGQVLTAVMAAGAAGLATLANLLALCWFGMWMGLTSKTANLATLKTLLFVQIIPWFVISFGTTVLVWALLARFMFQFQAGGSFEWWPLVNGLLSAGLAIAKDIGFILWARNRLFASFRLQAAQGFARAPQIALPPVIARA